MQKDDYKNIPTISKKTDIIKYRKKKKINQKSLAKFKIFILKYYDPISSHRFYGDFIIPDKLWKFDGDPICSFKLYRDYKSIRNVHVRNNGVVLELEDYEAYKICPIKFIQSRLMSLGDSQAYELAIFLEKYCKLFEKNQNLKDHLTSTKNTDEETMLWIDDFFENNQENGAFVRVNKMVNSFDFRTKYLGINFKMLEFLTNEISFSSEKFIDDFLGILTFKNFEDFTNIIKSSICMQTFPKSLNTKIGEIQIFVDVKIHHIKSERNAILNFTYPKEQFHPKLALASETWKAEKIKQTKTNDKHYIENYGEVIKLYYLKKK